MASHPKSVKVNVVRVPQTRAAEAAVDAAITKEPIDVEIDRSLETGEPINMEAAFPSPVDPGTRMAAIGQAAGKSSYQKEARMRLLHRLLMRNLPTDMIAQQLQVSIYTVHQLRKELNDRLKEEARNIDTYSFFGRTMAFYDEVRGTALRMATDVKIAAGPRVGALTVALGAEAGKHRFLELAGFFDHNRFAPPAPETIDSVERGRKQLGLLLDMQFNSLNGNEDVSYIFPDEAEGTSDLDADADDIQLL